jgi:GTP-binding protein
MKINSADFVKGLVGPDSSLEDGKPQIAFVGRSNVGKSSVINSLTHKKDLARTSSFPGRTQEINLFLINKVFYLVDLPGYGYAKASKDKQEDLQKLIYWYLIETDYEKQKVVLIIDAKVGLTDTDMEMLGELEERGKNIIVVVNKIDKLKKLAAEAAIKDIKEAVGDHVVIPYSAKNRIGLGQLTDEMLKKVA